MTVNSTLVVTLIGILGFNHACFPTFEQKHSAVKLSDQEIPAAKLFARTSGRHKFKKSKKSRKSMLNHTFQTDFSAPCQLTLSCANFERFTKRTLALVSLAYIQPW